MPARKTLPWARNRGRRRAPFVSVTHSAGSSAVGCHIHRLEVCLGRRQGLGKRCHRPRPGAAPPPPPRRCPDPPRARACRPGAWWSFILAILASGSLLETQSWFESFLPLRLRSRRSSAVGVSIPLSWAKRSSITLARVPPPAAPRWPPWSRHPPRCVALHQTRLGDQRHPVKHRRVDFMGHGSVTARNGLHLQPGTSEQRHSSPRSESIPSK